MKRIEKNMPGKSKWTRCGLMVLAALSGPIAVAETGEGEETVFLPPVTVTGESRDTTLLPGAITVVGPEMIRRAQPRSTDDLLRRVPGVFVKAEEESAVVSNVGIRGLPAGDYKTLVLEDGVPIQPGIFVGNSRYFNPRVQRMEGVELLKGAASLRYGPNTIGGVINFLTRMPEEGVTLTGQYGSWNTREGTLEIGGRSESGDSRFGAMITRARSDGFMDRAYDMTDVMVKTETILGENHIVGTKFLYYQNDANISYRGLFPDAYRAGARFNPGPDDFFETERMSFDISHGWRITPEVSLQTLVYWSEMNRDYWRYTLNADNPTTLNADGFRVWNFSDEVQGNNRAFTRTGIDSRLTARHGLFGLGNEAEFGVRLMEEEMEDVTLRANRATPRNPNNVPLRNRLDSAESLAVFAQNRFDVTDALSLTAGARLETYRQKRDDLRSAGGANSFSNTEIMPGVGATFRLNDSAQLFGSVYRAFAPPLVGSVVGVDNPPTDAETSLNLELGIRGGTERTQYQVAVFQMDFSNQVDPGVSGIRDPNQGSALIQGVEAALGVVLGHGLRLDTNVTWIPTAEFGEDRPGEALKGNRLPDSAEWMGNVSLSYEEGRFQTALLLNVVGEAFGDGMNTRELTTEQTGAIWGGRIPSYFTLDLTARFAVTDALSVFGSVNNLTDERYIAGLRQGIYTGPERSGNLGVQYRF